MYIVYLATEEVSVGSRPWETLEEAAAWLWRFWRAAGGDNSVLHAKYVAENYYIEDPDGARYIATRDFTVEMIRPPLDVEE